MLTVDDERRLSRSIAAGDDEARSRLIEANLPLVRAIAQRFLGLGVPGGDLVQEGTIGLTHAVDRYEWRNGSRFAAYASWWIRQAIIRALTDQARAIRLPHYLVARRIRVRRAESVLAARLGRPPTVEELAAETGLPREAVEAALHASEVRASLDRPLGADSESAADLLETLADPSALDPAELAEEIDSRIAVRDAVAALPARERDVVLRRFGFDDGVPDSLAEIAVDLGIARERVRQIEQHALARLTQRLDPTGSSPSTAQRQERRAARRPRRARRSR